MGKWLRRWAQVRSPASKRGASVADGIQPKAAETNATRPVEDGSTTAEAPAKPSRAAVAPKVGIISPLVGSLRDEILPRYIGHSGGWSLLSLKYRGNVLDPFLPNGLIYGGQFMGLEWILTETKWGPILQNSSKLYHPSQFDIWWVFSTVGALEIFQCQSHHQKIQYSIWSRNLRWFNGCVS